MSELKLVVACPPGAFNAGEQIEVRSNDVMRWVPTYMGATLRLRFSPVYVYGSIKLSLLNIKVEFKDVNENVLGERSGILSESSPQSEIPVPSGTYMVDVYITRKVMSVEAYQEVYPDRAWAPPEPSDILVLEMLDEGGSVIDSARARHGVTVTGMSQYYYVAVISTSPYAEFPVETYDTQPYILSLVATVTRVLGSPASEDYVELRTLDKYRVVISSCRVQPIYAYYSCAVGVTGEEAWVQVVLGTQQPGLTVDVEIEERIRGFL